MGGPGCAPSTPTTRDLLDPEGAGTHATAGTPEFMAPEMIQGQAREQGGVRVLLVRGPPGAGRTRLLHEIARRAHETGAAQVVHAGSTRAWSPDRG